MVTKRWEERYYKVKTEDPSYRHNRVDLTPVPYKIQVTEAPSLAQGLGAETPEVPSLPQGLSAEIPEVPSLAQGPIDKVVKVEQQPTRTRCKPVYLIDYVRS